MTRYAYDLRSSVAVPAVEEPEARESEARVEETEAPLEPGPVDAAAYGWRERYETLPDGSQVLRQMPLTYADLLDPQEEDYVAEDTVHRTATEGVAYILRRRFADDPSVAVFSNLKILFEIPGLTTGPMPDISVVVGVEDRKRRRWSFRYGEEPGNVTLTIEMVSVSSKPKDYRDILLIYSRLGVDEYLAIEPLGHYDTGPYALRFWRRDVARELLEPVEAETNGFFYSRTTGLLFGTGEEGWGLEVRDAMTGDRLLPPEEEIAEYAKRARFAEERAAREATARRQETAVRRQVEERAVREAEARRQEAEARRRAEAEVERLRAELERSKGE